MKMEKNQKMGIVMSDATTRTLETRNFKDCDVFKPTNWRMGSIVPEDS